jgi:hypothetical protein
LLCSPSWIAGQDPDPVGTMDRDSERWHADMEAKSKDSLGGMGLFLVGGLALGGGVSLLAFANRGKVLRYAATRSHRWSPIPCPTWRASRPKRSEPSLSRSEVVLTMQHQPPRS